MDIKEVEKLNFDKIKRYALRYTSLLFLLPFFLIPIVTVHEAGHLLVGRSVGLDINELNIGFGIPYLEILSLNFNFGDITFHIKPIMLGGYVTMPEEFESIEFYKKFSVYIAGCVFNIVSGILILTGLGIANKETILNSLKKSMYVLLSLITIENMNNRTLNNKYIGTLKQGGLIQSLLCTFSMASFVLAIINLLPIFPLDGGRIIFDSMMNEEEIGLAIMMSAINYWIITDRKRIITKLKSLTAL